MIQEPFKDKLFNYEVLPPATAWDAISNELVTSNELLSVSKKLFDYEVAPPAGAWAIISSSLLTGRELPTVTQAKVWNISLSKILAVAAILGIVITSALYFSNLDVLKNTLTISQIHKPNSTGANTQPNNSAAEAIIDDSDLSDVSSLAIEVPKERKNAAMDGKELKNTKIQQAILPASELEIIIAAKPIRNANGEIIQNNQLTNNDGNSYISITGPNGQQTKISSKFLHLLLFINDDNDIDQVDGYFDKNFLESLIWKSRFQDWRNKIINTSFVPSSTNFMDILEFKDLITMDKQ